MVERPLLSVVRVDSVYVSILRLRF